MFANSITAVELTILKDMFDRENGEDDELLNAIMENLIAIKGSNKLVYNLLDAIERLLLLDEHFKVS